MISLSARIASLVLAFGFFFGCSVIRGTSDDTPQQSAGNLPDKQFGQRITAIDKQLRSDQYNADLYYEKGSLLTKWAQNKKDPVQRTPIYSKAGVTLQKADSLSEARPGRSTIDSDQINQLQGVAWSNEHNQGVQMMQDASSTHDYQRAAIHFDNAAAIMPDRTTSYKMASQTYYKGKEPQKAIAVLERARDNITPPSIELLESLAFLYLETGQLSKAITMYEETRSLLNHNFNLMHGLSNAYIKAEKHQNAIRLLQQLADRKPGNITYRYSLASEFYKAGREQILTMVDNLEEGKNFNATALATADSLFDQAESHYTFTLQRQPENTDFTYKAVQFYQNRAAQYQRLLPYLDANEKRKITDAIEQNVSASLPLLEQLTEQNPTEELWEFLYRTYSYLGMKEEAQEAKANF